MERIAKPDPTTIINKNESLIRYHASNLMQ
jgi:hypothetical protein